MSIKQIYQRIRKQAFFPLLLPLSFTLLFSVIFSLYDFGQILFPKYFSAISQISATDLSTPSYIILNKAKLHYTGYDVIKNQKVKGRYYYSIQNHVCYFVLLDEKISANAKEIITLKNVRLHLIPLDNDFDGFISEISKDLDYSHIHLLEDTAPFVAVQSDSLFRYSIIAFILSMICLCVTTIIVLNYFMVILFPASQKRLFPKCHRNLKKQMLSQLSFELANNRFDSQETNATKIGFFFTDSFLVNFSSRHTKILPINEIVWVYKHIPKTTHKPWENPVRYSIHLVLKNRQHIILHGFEENNADILIALLHHKKKDILVGYSTEHLYLAKKIGNSSAIG